MEEMIRKRPLSHVTRESMSSEETVTSKPPKDVLALGVHLVRELGLVRSNDTLGRWLAHHLSELINAVDHASTPAEKSEKTNEATNIILHIWERRAALPGDANPLARYREALTALLERDDLYSLLSRREASEPKKLARKIRRDSERLDLLVALLDPGREIDKPETEEAVLSLLSEEERKTLHALDRFLNLSDVGFQWSGKSAEKQEDARSARQSTENFLNGMANDVEEIRELLLRKSRQKSGKKSRRGKS